MASPHLRHRSSLEGSIRSSPSPPLEYDKRSQARDLFCEIIEHYENTISIPRNDPYDRLKLLRLTFEYSATEKSKDNFLQAFFNAISLSIDEQVSVDFSNKELENCILSKLTGFADFLVHNFFLPIKASTGKTPQSSPVCGLAIQRGPSSETCVETSDPSKALRRDCLVRDRHRCVISRKFDFDEALERMEENPDDAQDDENNPLDDEFDRLEVAHILPHALMRPSSDSKLADSRAAALEILNMLDTDVARLIEGPETDRPRNALTLSHTMHLAFDKFQLFFEPIGESSNTYKIATFLPPFIFQYLPVTRRLFVTDERMIEPPSPRLLAVHRAIAHILHLSKAGHYVDKILLDRTESSAQVDGTTSLGLLVQLRIDGWWDGL